MEYIPAKRIIANTKSPDSWFGMIYNMNIYRGCCHGCIYCDSRSACYRVEHFDSVRAKKDALLLIRNELERKQNKGVINSGAMSDPYNPHEAELMLTRNSLELINAYHFGAAIATKSPLVCRDADILRDIRKHSPVLVKMTITAAAGELAAKIEPNAPSPESRFAALKKLCDSGIYAGILMMPILPFISDTEENIMSIIEAAKDSGAKFIYPFFGLTLREGNREYYYEQLDALFPGLKEKYIRRFGNAYVCRSPQSRKLQKLFAEKCTEYGIRYTMKDIIIDYKRGYTARQLGLFTKPD